MGTLGALLSMLGAPAVHAQPSLLARGEVGAGAMISAYQRDELGYDEISVAGTARVGLRLVPSLSIQAGIGYWLFPSDEEAGTQLSLTAGARFEPWLFDAGRFFVDANAGLGWTGDDPRATLDMGIGYELDLGSGLGAGPFARYGQTLATEGDSPTDARFFIIGISATLGSARRAEPIAVAAADRDMDGVEDSEDQCATIPAGNRPDPARLGCPTEDADGDGVPDSRDQCPAVPAGDHPDPARPGCSGSTEDVDGDGVLNRDDVCPNEPQGAHPDPSRMGCPAGDAGADADHDGVPDASDRCPDRPGPRDGCPAIATIEGVQIRIDRPVFFASDSDRILARSRPVLQAVADLLRAHREIRRVVIEGHTDDRGAAEYNMQLSERRARGVRDFLVRAGIEGTRLEAQGLGATRMIDRSGTPEAHARNRRVEFHIAEGGATAAPNEAPSGAQ